MAIPSPIAFWRCTEGAGATLAEAINSQHAALAGDYKWIAGGGLDGHDVIHFDKALPYGAGEVGTDPLFDLGATFTVSMWVKPITLANHQTFIGKSTSYTASNPRSWRIYTWGSGAIYVDDGASGKLAASAGSLVIGNWYHIVCVFQGGFCDTYIDNVWQTQTAFANNDNAAHVLSLGSFDNNSLPSDHYMQSVAIFDTALGVVPIGELYNAGIPVDLTPIPTPTAYWKFNENAGATAAIAVGNPADALALAGTAGWEAGAEGSALSLPGLISAYAHNTTPSFASVKTISFWFNPDNIVNAAAAAQAILTLRGVNSGNWVCVGIGSWSGAHADEIIYLIEDRGPVRLRGWFDAAGSISAGSWHHVVIVDDSVSGWEFWVDGDKKTTSGDAVVALPDLERIVAGVRARSGTAYDAPYSGGLDELAFWAEELEDYQVITLYNGGTPLNLGGGTTHDLEAEITGLGSIQADLLAIRGLNASIQALGSIQADLLAIRDLEASIQALGYIEATLVGMTWDLEAVIAALGYLQADLLIIPAVRPPRRTLQVTTQEARVRTLEFQSFKTRTLEATQSPRRTLSMVAEV